jgi:hypothetical protein
MHLISERNMELSNCYTVVARYSRRGTLADLYNFKALHNPPGLSLFQTGIWTTAVHRVGREATIHGLLLLANGYYDLAPWAS